MVLRETLVVMSASLVDEAALDLLIRSTDGVDAPINPDPVAMRRALRALERALRLRDESAALGVSLRCYPLRRWATF